MNPINIEQAFALAFHHHKAGNLAKAEALYREILARQPTHIGALNNLGVLAQECGRNELAADLLRQSLAINPNSPQTYNNLANALQHAGKADEAVQMARHALALLPNFPEAYLNLGNALSSRGEQQAAIAAFRRAAELKPDYAAAWRNLGKEFTAGGQWDEAIAACRKAIALDGTSPKAYGNLGNALQGNGMLIEAKEAYLQAIKLQPDYVIALNNLANVLRSHGDRAGAIAYYRKVIALAPDIVEAHTNLGNVLKDDAQLDESIAAHQRAIAINPKHAASYNNLAGALTDQGRVDDAIAQYALALELRPKYPVGHSNLLLALHYPASFDPAAVAEEHRRWNQMHASSLAPNAEYRHGNSTEPDRRLRIGYVSADFKEHSISRFILPLLAHHDRSAFEVFAYAQVSFPDEISGRIKSHVDVWRSIVGLSDDQFAELLRSDRIDLLVDLSGHTCGHRLLVFARKPAPVQVTYLGYPDTTGLTSIDYRLTDSLADPPGKTETFHSEKLIRLDPCAWCFAPTIDVPLPERRTKQITFGCFNTVAKVTQPMLELWGRILLSVPESNLLLKSAGLSSPTVRRDVEQTFERLGIDSGRLELRGQEQSYHTHLTLYERMDIALDTFPYHGTTTTCEALWMGTPVISLAGASHVSRVGASLLSNVGLPELIAHSPEAYVRIAVELATDRSRLDQLHSSLRHRMERSELMNARQFALRVEDAYRMMWKIAVSAAEIPLE